MISLFRIASRLYPVFDGTGAFLKGGRWNGSGRHVIYCAENPSCCRLELLVHIGRTAARPANHAFVEVAVPDEVYAKATVVAMPPPEWDHPTDLSIAQDIGNAWFDSRKSLILKAPSVASRGDWVIAINQRHPDFPQIKAGPEQPLDWDGRLFAAK